MSEEKTTYDFIFPEATRGQDTIRFTISRALARKLQDAVVHRIFKTLLTPDEYDELLVSLTRALEE